ncbi:hypothetical protein NL108_008300 [Boleophthalmus pectinirostris]|nr:hypothetical protein NL108_008300 [Boleophthalmus pectinirostris]
MFCCHTNPGTLVFSGRASQQVRQGSTVTPDFHAKYGTAIMLGGAAFCVGVWSYVLTQTGLTWNLSPVGKVQPIPWRQAEEEE